MLPVPDISMVPALLIAPPESETPLSVSVWPESTWTVPVSVMLPPVIGGAVQRQNLAAVDRQLGVTELSFSMLPVPGDLDGAGIGDRAAGKCNAAQRQRLAGIDMDGAGVGDVATGNRGAVQRQNLAAVDRQLGVAENVVSMLPVPVISMVPALVIAPPLMQRRSASVSGRNRHGPCRYR